MKRIVALLFCVAMGSAFAQPYVGASGAYTTVDLPVSGAASVDDSDIGWKAFAGYRWTHFSVEGAYVKLGEASASNGGASLVFDAREVWAASVRSHLPVGGLFLRVGLFKAEFEARGVINGRTVFTETNGETGALVGFGTEQPIGKRWAVRAEWEHYENDASIDSFSLGAVYRF